MLWYLPTRARARTHTHTYTHTHTFSADRFVKQHKYSAQKRRCNENYEIEKLGELLPFTADDGKTYDKISVLRLTSSYIKFQNFMKSGERREEGREEDGLDRRQDKEMGIDM